MNRHQIQQVLATVEGRPGIYLRLGASIASNGNPLVHTHDGAFGMEFSARGRELKSEIEEWVRSRQDASAS